MSSFFDKHFFEKFTVEAIPKYVYLVSIFFFLGSLWYQWIYYSSFGVNIFHYMGLSESLSNFIDKIPILLVISVSSVLYLLFLQVVFERWLIRIFHSAKYNRRTRLAQFNKTSILLLILFLLPFISIAAIIPSLFPSFVRTDGFMYLRAVIVTFNIYFFIIVPIVYSRSKYQSFYDYKTPLIITSIVLFFINIYYYNKIQIWGIINSPKNKYDKISWNLQLTNEQKIVSSDSTYLLGKTNDYIFILYPRPSGLQSKTRIIKVSDIKEFEIIKYVRWYSILP